LRAIVFANGRPSDAGAPRVVAEPGDLIIAADGGAAGCRAQGLMPDVVVGDLDSLPAADLQRLAAGGVEIVGHPARKDHTDLDLALQLALERGADEVLVHGALGLRWDMTLANVLLGAAPHLAAARIGFVDGDQVLWPLRGGGRLGLAGQPGDTVSLIPLCGDAQGVTTSGLEWPLRQETLSCGTTRGVSNVLVGDSASVTLERGLLLCVHVRAGHH
jgi:thiamine pyrophosphokinase